MCPRCLGLRAIVIVTVIVLMQVVLIVSSNSNRNDGARFKASGYSARGPLKLCYGMCKGVSRTHARCHALGWG